MGIHIDSRKDLNLNTSQDIDHSTLLALNSRISTIQMCERAKAVHVASSLSVIDILSVLYAGAAVVSPTTINEPDRDIVIVSKGHAAAGTYAVLAHAGFFSTRMLDSYGEDHSSLSGHVTTQVPGIELSTGSLGHGLSVGAGIALGAKRSNLKRKVFVVLSDGECDEGSTWEAALFIAHHGLDNVIVLIDRNGIQSLDFTENVLRLEPLAKKWRAFGWDTQEIDGHDHTQLWGAISNGDLPKSMPRVIICQTTKGKGATFMENQVLWHYRPPGAIDSLKAIAEITGN
jgi:transketolase